MDFNEIIKTFGELNIKLGEAIKESENGGKKK